MPELPIHDVLPRLREALRGHESAVLQAPPGAGKTTVVPPALLSEAWLADARIVMLEPRRLAARAAARRIAELLDESVGQTVGYRVRMDTRVSAATRIEVVTEGVLTRMLQSDPALEGVGAVTFDEYHERSVHADLGLALTLQTRALLRPDLRLLVMSATLDGAAVAELLGPATPVIRSEGRTYPVETRYRDRPVDGRIEPAAARTVRRAVREESGDVLVFLPGQAEIRRVARTLDEAGLPGRTRIAPLYGRLSEADQDRAIRPSRPGERKVVLSTPIAETSLTIEGIRVVIDSGLVRVPRFSPRTGMTRLETTTISRASAEQRRGRAGRLEPGVCYRLWTEAEQRQLPPRSTPEILDADLAPLALELAVWGVRDPAELRWLDPPPDAAFAQALELLRWLGAVDGDGRVTEHGERMARLGLHPRLAHMALRSRALGLEALACDIAAVLGGRDFLRRPGGLPQADLRLRLETMRRARQDRGHATVPAHGHEVSRGGLRRALREARHWRSRLKANAGEAAAGAVEASGLLLGFAYPDRIARRRGGREPRYLMRNGRGAAFVEPEPVAQAPWLVAADLHDRGRDSRILLAAPIDESEVRDHFGDQIERADEIAWDAGARRVRTRRRERLGAIVLKDSPLGDADPHDVVAALLDGIRDEGLGLLPWSRAARRLRERIGFLHRLDPADWPDTSDDALLGALEAWLAPHLYGMRSADDLRRIDMVDAMRGLVSWELQRRLDELAPDRIAVPSGSRIRVDYSDPAAPVLAVRIQELFGLADTPRIAGGRVPLTIHLLSPAQRPVQVTRDLENFWRETYFEVRKDLKGRYPKHYWPDDPLTAPATRHTRPRR